MVTFHDLVKFDESKADLATDPVFSPDALKAEGRKVPGKPRFGSNQSHRTATGQEQPQDQNQDSSTNKNMPRVLQITCTPQIEMNVLSSYSQKDFVLVVSRKVITQWTVARG